MSIVSKVKEAQDAPVMDNTWGDRFFGLIILRGSLVTIRKMPSISKPLSESDVSIYAGIIIGGRGRPVKPIPLFAASLLNARTAHACLA